MARRKGQAENLEPFFEVSKKTEFRSYTKVITTSLKVFLFTLRAQKSYISFPILPGACPGLEIFRERRALLGRTKLCKIIFDGIFQVSSVKFLP